jgi:hypothetical protein
MEQKHVYTRQTKLEKNTLPGQSDLAWNKKISSGENNLNTKEQIFSS